ncbi:TonB-dependent receptor [Alteromonas sp. KUL49]|uniref:TonB-dependent receptor plug domain-containing protein n=1 Tax=Alteromonas sp. KUL49 TaxID=2480798 RepID=UPI00102F025A|nr:TonB-dependent receptor [Alteromonas sp. KUL49]TAP40826.1 hypothetical protein EYS00_06865 [Alteromonas sp. KUL49]GEA11003.1 hypothetical protein KUL49_13780 [Alteromonas sp. KUL49]
MRNMVFATVSLLLCGVTAASDYKDDDALFSMSLDELLEAEFTTATLTPEKIDTVPAAYSIFSRNEIRSLGVRYLHELLDYVPGFQVTRYSDFPQQYSASSRGLSVGSSSRKILFLIDGFTANDPRAGSGVNLLNYSIDHIEKVEVLRGPGSAIYGSNAFTGVVNVITRNNNKRVRIQSGNEITSDVFSQWHTDMEDITMSAQINMINARGGHYTVRDFLNGGHKNISDPYQQRSIIIGLSNTQHKLNVHYRYRDADDFYSIQRLSDRYENRSVSSMTSVQYQYDYHWLEDISATFQLSHITTRLESSAQSTPVGAFKNISVPDTDDPLFGTGYLESRGIKATWINDYRLNKGVSVQFGASIQNNDETLAEGTTNFDLDAVLNLQFPVPYSPNIDFVSKVGQEDDQDAGGAFIQYQHQKNDLNWVLGLRYDRFESIGGRFTPRLGLVYRSNKNFQWKLLYGEAFRSPDLAELSLFNGVGRVGNRSLRFESTQSIDFISQYTSNETRASVNYFITEYKDPIINAVIAGRTTLINGEDSRVKGLEVEVKHFFTQHTWIRTAHTRFHQLPESAFRESKTLFNFHLNHSIAGKVSLGIGGDYRSARKTLLQASPQEFNRVEGYWRLRLSGYYEYDNTLTFSFIVNNLEGTQPIGPALGSALPDGVVHPGRQWTAGFEWEFD